MSLTWSSVTHTFIAMSWPSLEATMLRVYRTHLHVPSNGEEEIRVYRSLLKRTSYESVTAEERRKNETSQAIKNDIACKLNIIVHPGSCWLLISVSICTEGGCRGVNHHSELWYRSLDYRSTECGTLNLGQRHNISDPCPMGLVMSAP